uniref:Large ribosomal subunit protein uL18m n=1 Tax=Ciona savignyi TaxID=51511 RepID=H2YC30_CIOSA
MFTTKLLQEVLKKSTIRVIPAIKAHGGLSSLDECLNNKSNQNATPLRTFLNKNPRNLERMALAHKDEGWGNRTPETAATNWPAFPHYHRIILERTGKHTYATLLHYHGRRVIEVSTREWSIQQQIYKGNDVCTCYNVGRVFVERCIRSGISCAAWTIPNNITDGSQSITAFREALTSSGFVLKEPDQISFRSYQPPHMKREGPEAPTSKDFFSYSAARFHSD